MPNQRSGSGCTVLPFGASASDCGSSFEPFEDTVEVSDASSSGINVDSLSAWTEVAWSEDTAKAILEPSSVIMLH